MNDNLNFNYNDNPIKQNGPNKHYEVYFALTAIFLIIIFRENISKFIFDNVINIYGENEYEIETEIGTDIEPEIESEIECDNLKDYLSVNDLEVGKYYYLKASSEEKYSYSMYLSANSADGEYASIIYYFPDKTRVIINFPPKLLIKDDYITNFHIIGKLYKDRYGPYDYKMDIERENVLYISETWQSDEYINIDTIKTVDDLLDGQKYYFETNNFDGKVNWITWPHYLVTYLSDGTEIWFVLREEEQEQDKFDRRYVYEAGVLKIDKRFRGDFMDMEGFTVYVVSP